MVKKVAYFLGAGFSRPWGLPLMDDFIHKSKELYLGDQQKYSHFKDFYNLIDSYSKIKNVLNIDLYNIENLLSLVEMSEKVVQSPIVKMVEKFIVDVIEAYTKPFIPYRDDVTQYRLPSNYKGFVFGNNYEQKCYIHFFANLINLILSYNPNTKEFSASTNPNLKMKYAVVSLNYDMIIENSYKLIHSQYPICKNLISTDEYDPNWEKLNFAKIHGSVENGEIIPPTWNKSRSNEVQKKWKLAFDILSNANIIRIVGYSLPETDTYIKYLLGVAIKHNFHIEKVEAICIDNHGDIQKRYEGFFVQKYFKFINKSFFDSRPNFHSLFSDNGEKMIMDMLE